MNPEVVIVNQVCKPIKIHLFACTCDIGHPFKVTNIYISDLLQTLNSFSVSPEGSASVSQDIAIVNFSDDVSLLCSALGGPLLSYQWEMNGTIVSSDSELILASIDVTFGGNYVCTVSNAAGNDTTSTMLYVTPYFPTRLETDILSEIWSSVDITCNAVGFPSPTVVWEDKLGGRVSNTSRLEFSPVTFGIEGVYRCIAFSDINGEVFSVENQTTIFGKHSFMSESACITKVYNLYISTVSPLGGVAVDPTSINATQNSNAAFNCAALGGPMNTYTWRREDNTGVSSDSELTLIDIQASDGGDYTCSVENPAGEDNVTVNLIGKFRLIVLVLHIQLCNIHLFEGVRQG